MSNDNDVEFVRKVVFWACFLAVIFGFIYFMHSNFISPVISVWQQGKLGEAELARADSNRQIATLEANAKKESAKALADAEVIRAEGVAKANKIIGDSLQGNEAYLRYLYINQLGETNDKTVIYIPVEAGLPILEATRLQEKK